MRSGQYISQQTGYKAFIPTPLPPEPPITMDGPMQQLLSDANIALGRLDTMGYLLPNINHIIAMYVRKEALLSSQIEGTQASLEDIFEYESHTPLKNIQDVQEVINYIKALNHGLERIKEFPMSIRLIKEIHNILLSDTPGNEKTPGEFKRSQNWIGPGGSTLKNASFIPPPPAEALDAIGQLELFMHKENELPILIECALIHYQFETIHPFLDGNGRLGRLLITFYLCWKGIMQKPLLYLSFYFKLNRQEYYDRLNIVREHGNYEQWIAFFLKGIIWTSASALDTIKTLLSIADKHKKLLLQKKISSPLSIALLDYLFVKPHLSVQEAADKFQTSYQTAQTVVNHLVEMDILKEITGKKRDRRYSYWEYLDCLSEGTNF
ncbi:MAG: Fic family protein [Parachlamydiaceae bacterium]|nr:Fic family protein [Parachlamydiaceae bacterium]